MTEITPDTFMNVLGMANSADKENQVVALTCLENIDSKKNLVYTLLLKKMANITHESWKEHAPKTYAFLQSVDADPQKVVTYKKMLQILVENKTSLKDMTFFLSMFGEHLKDSIKNLGYEFVEDLDITIKLKSKDGTTISSKEFTNQSGELS